MDVSQKHHATWEDPAVKEYTLYDSIIMTCKRQTENRLAVGRERAGGGLSIKGTEMLLEVMEMFSVLIYAFTKLKYTFKKGEFYFM